MKTPRTNGKQNTPKKTKINKFPEFKEHKDTEQLMYNLGEFKKGDTVYITLKMHGTSQRTGYLRQIEKINWFEKHILRYKEKKQISLCNRYT